MAADWQKWTQQTAAVVSFEIRKFFSGRKWAFPLLLALAPVSLITMLLLFDRRPPSNNDFIEIYAVMFQTFMLRLMIVFGCALVFAGLYRGDMVTRTMHFYLLTPLRREVLVAGKYIAGLIITGSLYTASVAITNILMHTANGQAVAESHFYSGPGTAQLLNYMGIALLACLGYGSVFMLTGFLFKNPSIPAAFVVVWESINVFLPSALKQISVVYYLQSITPVPIPFGPFAVITAPASVFTSVFGLMVFTLVVLVVNGLVMRTAEINYSSD